ncbi:cysteine-tRNA ligase [Kockovaella imperatae]|uniref:cysteine--tRNA ligase n=1 Tax=Kockovaella imperatae TaxID=4999 RepID=A0A1Y1UNT6_9TREE|nr:cysteine-tRNA ligase [Kockovaella imperatae]ORX39710.1 cysteine-tRNA ligase [Kockovaella imperatae]
MLSLRSARILVTPLRSPRTQSSPLFNHSRALLHQRRQLAKMAASTEDRASSSMPVWIKPSRGTEVPVLKVYNSLTRTKDEFIPTKGMSVDWYNCGPTVYDASHMGHARNYLTQDIVRRILRDYFGYDVNFVMNITDIDDKIILRAREQYLLDQAIESNPTLSSTLLEDTHTAFSTFFESKLLKSLPSPVPPRSPNDTTLNHFALIEERNANDAEFSRAAKEKEEKWSMYLSNLSKSAQAIKLAEKRSSSGETGGDSVRDLVEGTSGVLGPYYGQTLAHTVSDPIGICRSLTAHWEAKFFQDMARLRVLPPDVITRVSEYIPEIVSFVQRIVDRGFAYEGGGSIWFDVNKFEGASEEEEGNSFKHEYAKLQPSSKGNKKLLDEGEGALTASSGKRQAADFAIWKAKSKPGEPAWASPWGEGRPGWHIECSVMASAILGKGMDIHSGGVDLMFPHHDNELAQSEAYHGCQQWVNYFLHTGHLHIEGLKMSKSLKNFITIDEALAKFSARQLRLAFMLQLWNAKMDFREDLLKDVRTKEDLFDNFFSNVKARLNQAGQSGPSPDGKHHFDAPEHALMNEFHSAQQAFRASLCDSFNTPQAISTLVNLVGEVNTYISKASYNAHVLEPIAEWVTRMLRMFGLGEGGATGGIGWGKEGDEAGGADFESRLDKYLKAMSSFRDDVRKLAISGGSSKDMLALCDRFRDEDLVNLGVQLDDGQGADGSALYKLVDPAVLLRAREEKAAIAADKAAKKAANAAAAEAKRKEQLEKGRVDPKDMFKPPNVPQGAYTEWDDAGLPLKDGEGKDVAKSQLKKLVKEQKVQEKLHEAFLAWQASGES